MIESEAMITYLGSAKLNEGSTEETASIIIVPC